MKRSKKSLFNLIFGVSNQIVTLIIGLIVPKLFIVTFGSEVNGLQSSIAYIYTYIALLESGIGTATIQALYGAVGNNNKDDINSILSATNAQYKRISLIYFFCMCVFAVIYPWTISATLPKITISLMVLLSGFGSLLSFLTYGKFVLLLQTDGRGFVCSIIGLAVSLLKNAVKIVLIYCEFSIIAVYIGEACIGLIVLIVYRIYQKKYYPWISYQSNPNYKAISQSRNVLVHQISGIVCNSTDVLVLTYIVKNLALVSVYNLYCMVFDAVKSLINNIFSSVHYVMGQTFQTNIVLYRKYHNLYEIADFMVSFTLYSVAYVMILPFMRLYTHGITDINYVDTYVPLLFVCVKLLSSLREPASQLINYAGHFKNTQARSIIETTINLLVSVFAAKVIGIYGVLLGTVIALLYRTVDMYFYTSKNFLDRGVWKSFRQWLIYFTAFAVVVFANCKIRLPEGTYLTFFVCTVVVGFVMLIYYGIVTAIFNRDVVKILLKLAKERLKST